MHRGVTAGAPARAAPYERRVRNVANEKLAARRVHLGVAFEAKIIVALHEQLVRNRPVRLMTDRASLAQCFMFVDHRPSLGAMTFGAGLIQLREAGSRTRAEDRTMRCLENVRAVRVVALHTIHPIFEHRMVVRQFELCMDIDMAIETGLRVAAGIDDELAAAPAGVYVQAPWTMA